MTKQTILDAVRDELLATNKLCGTEGFSETDYTCLGMVSFALDKVDFDAAREDEAVGFLDTVRDYEKESGNKVCYDERTSREFYQLYLKHKNEKL